MSHAAPAAVASPPTTKLTVDTVAKTYKIESFRFLIDASDGQPSNQFPGWPVVIHQRENRGENLLR